MPRVAKKDATNESGEPEVSGQEVNTVVVELPLSEPYTHHFPIHIDLQLSQEVGATLRRIARAYDRQQATLKNGRRVVDATTALRKILETIADAA